VPAPTSRRASGATWMLYGANGYTGRLVAARALEVGEEPVLAGRDAANVAELAEELGLAWRAFPLGDPGSVRANVIDVAAVLCCAGPFVHTSAPLVEACLATGTHYLDVTGEIPVFEAVLGRAAAARAAGVALLPGVGFDVVPSDCLAAKLAAALPAAVELELAFAAVGGSWSRGTLKTVIEGLPHLGAVRRDRRIVAVPAAWDEKTIPFSCGPRRAVTIPWGDVSTAYHTTGIPNVRVYAAMPPRQIAWLRRLRPVAPWLGTRPLKRMLQDLVAARVTGPDRATRERARMCLWGRAAAAPPPAGDGAEVTLTLDTPEGYSFTAVAAVECVRRVLAGAVEPGAWTPSRAFGAGFVESLPGVVVGRLATAPAGEKAVR